MVADLSLSLPRIVALFLVNSVVKILWIIDRVTGLDLRYISKTIARSILFAILLSFFSFLAYSYSTGYLHKVATVVLIPEYVPTEFKASVVSYPVLIGSDPAPFVTAKSALAIEKSRERILFEKNPAEELAPASTVKLMTALVALDIYDMEETVPVPEICTRVEGTKAWFPSISEFKVRDLIYAMLVGSAGDAACTLSQAKISEEDFISLMNSKAVGIGLNSTIFSNPIGLDNINGGHHSTASDLYKLAAYATSVPEIQEAVSRESFLLSSADGNYRVNLNNTNRLLREIPNTLGIKTGTTEGAGEVLIYEYKDDLKDIVIIVMGSRDRFGDTVKILNWIGKNYTWE
jgi:D-alanyl-D-alanine carboxypeptidase (penicillin-binding protein 5/6)